MTSQTRLPTLEDVLHRQSQPPVCLFNYYIVLRDRLAMETLLDFWLDVAQANLLFKRYSRQFKVKEPKVEGYLSIPVPDILTHMLLFHPRASLSTPLKKVPPTQAEMMDAVEHIYLRYIMPNAEKELHQLPQEMRDTIGHHFNSMKNPSPLDNPIIYADAKVHVHQLLQSTFPLFLRYKVFMNLTMTQQMSRFIAGLLLLLMGFSLEFSFIFLDIHPWQNRLWGIFPIGMGIFCMVTCVSGIDPIWVLIFNISETIPFRFNSIIQPDVKHILQMRSYFILGIILFITFIILLFFCSLAGNRL